MRQLSNPLIAERIYKSLLIGMAVFYFFEFVIHFFGLPVLEHDKIFLPTHDRYIALYGLTIGGLLTMLATSHRQDKSLYRFTTFMMLLGGLNAIYISVTHAYGKYFGEYSIDSDLALLGVGVVVWYIALKIFEHRSDIKRR